MTIQRYSLTNFARDCYDILKSDRDCFIATAGMTGEGKSVFAIQLSIEYSVIAGVPFNMDCLTWSRDELLEWIDGPADGHKAQYGGQKPPYSVALPDELISMFYKRNWYEDAQKGAIELTNKCRDRHLLIPGNVPNFFDLDSGLMSRFRFYIFIPKRGIAWVFKQDDNPFTSDKWNAAENKKVFRKKGTPYNCPNFLCEIEYPDLSPEQKKEYYNIRNTKRRFTENQNKYDNVERYGKVKQARDRLIKLVAKNKEKLGFNTADLAEITGLSESMIRYILGGER